MRVPIIAAPGPPDTLILLSRVSRSAIAQTYWKGRCWPPVLCMGASCCRIGCTLVAEGPPP